MHNLIRLSSQFFSFSATLDPEGNLGGQNAQAGLLSDSDEKDVENVSSTTNLPSFLPLVAPACIVGGVGARGEYWIGFERGVRQTG